MAPLYPYLVAFSGMAWHGLGRRCIFERNKYDTLVRLLELIIINPTLRPVPGFTMRLYVQTNMELIVSSLVRIRFKKSGFPIQPVYVLSLATSSPILLAKHTGAQRFIVHHSSLQV